MNEKMSTVCKTIPILNDYISDLIKENMDCLQQCAETDLELDLSKEFRFKQYPLVLLLLKNPLKELISTSPPLPEEDCKNTKQNGVLYLYDGKVPNYTNDGIQWKKTRMSVKLIVYNKEKGIYKLKNHKEDEGLVVMRRQTFQGIENGWRKNEYKLVNRETLYKPEADGSFSTNEWQTVQDAPLLVHYFKKHENGNVHHNGKRPKPEPGTEISSLTVSPNTMDELKEELYFLSDPSLQLNNSISVDENNNSSNQKIIYSTPIPIVLPTPYFEIISYAPDTGPSKERTKVIVILPTFSFGKPLSYYYSLEGMEFVAKIISPGVAEISMPPHQPGTFYFWFVVKEPESKSVYYSNTIPFYYTPVDEIGKVSLALRNLLNDERSKEIICKFKYTAKELDLSNNSLVDLDFLSEFTILHTLILDHNQITSTSKLPYLAKLHTLCINCNLISVLQPFIENIAKHFPSLQYLSLLGNDACPFFSKEHHYYNYRIYVISRLRKLTQLDSSPVTPEEWKHASCLVSEEDEPPSPPIPLSPFSPSQFQNF